MTDSQQRVGVSECRRGQLGLSESESLNPNFTASDLSKSSTSIYSKTIQIDQSLHEARSTGPPVGASNTPTPGKGKQTVRFVWAVYCQQCETKQLFTDHDAHKERAQQHRQMTGHRVQTGVTRR